MVTTRSQTRKMKQASIDQQSAQSRALIVSNDDLLTEIIIRLPAKSILRFKSVSKHWLWLLSHKHFTHRYDKLSKSPGTFAVISTIYVPFNVDDQNPPPFSSLDSYFNSDDVRIVQSCNGLLLCHTRREYEGDHRYYVFNPTTKQLATIPPVCGELKGFYFMALAFHQKDCPHYKVICVRAFEPHGILFQLQIYSSETRKWKIAVESFSAHSACFCGAVYWNGAILWAPRVSHYMYFKVDVEQLHTLPLPEGLISSEILAMYFGESRDHLHLIVYKYPEENHLLMNVYEMLRDHSGWFVKYVVDLDVRPAAFQLKTPLGFCEFRVIDVVRGESEEDTFMLLHLGEKIIRYNFHDRSFKQIFTLPPISYKGLLNFHRYTETLTLF
ncbi:F-box protein At5g07610-like [Bidens hawaiensis]|uniref:F-box protein At5g07610-like n=1 Tax=Bidens hawaiensis TaxID=980011 RepID=UPI0040491F51